MKELNYVVLMSVKRVVSLDIQVYDVGVGSIYCSYPTELDGHEDFVVIEFLEDGSWTSRNDCEEWFWHTDPRIKKDIEDSKIGTIIRNLTTGKWKNIYFEDPDPRIFEDEHGNLILVRSTDE